MIIAIKKFGTTLISRSAGKEALLAFSPILRAIKKDEKIEVDFEGVVAMGPSWLDEFLTPLAQQYKGRIAYRNTENPSVKATLEILEQAKKKQRGKTRVLLPIRLQHHENRLE